LPAPAPLPPTKKNAYRGLEKIHFLRVRKINLLNKWNHNLSSLKEITHPVFAVLLFLTLVFVLNPMEGKHFLIWTNLVRENKIGISLWDI